MLKFVSVWPQVAPVNLCILDVSFVLSGKDVYQWTAFQKSIFEFVW